MSSAARARDIHHGALVRLSASYDLVWDAVSDKDRGKYEFPMSLLRRGKEEVRTLLGVEEDELAALAEEEARVREEEEQRRADAAEKAERAVAAVAVAATGQEEEEETTPAAQEASVGQDRAVEP
jgi:hypothetical protein